jgi:hypothetical protein
MIHKNRNAAVTMVITMMAGVAGRLYTCIWEALNLNLNKGTGYLDYGFYCFPQSLHANAKILPHLGYKSFLSESFPIHQSFYHSTHNTPSPFKN